MDDPSTIGPVADEIDRLEEVVEERDGAKIDGWLVSLPDPERNPKLSPEQLHFNPGPVPKRYGHPATLYIGPPVQPEEERLVSRHDSSPEPGDLRAANEHITALEARIEALEEGVRVSIAIQKIFHNRISRLENK